MSLLIKNAIIVNADKISKQSQDILLEDGLIKQIAPTIKEEKHQILCSSFALYKVTNAMHRYINVETIITPNASALFYTAEPSNASGKSRFCGVSDHDLWGLEPRSR